MNNIAIMLGEKGNHNITSRVAPYIDNVSFREYSNVDQFLHQADVMNLKFQRILVSGASLKSPYHDLQKLHKFATDNYETTSVVFINNKKDESATLEFEEIFTYDKFVAIDFKQANAKVLQQAVTEPISRLREKFPFVPGSDEKPQEEVVEEEIVVEREEEGLSLGDFGASHTETGFLEVGNTPASFPNPMGMKGTPPPMGQPLADTPPPFGNPLEDAPPPVGSPLDGAPPPFGNPLDDSPPPVGQPLPSSFDDSMSDFSSDVGFVETKTDEALFKDPLESPKRKSIQNTPPPDRSDSRPISMEEIVEAADITQPYVVLTGMPGSRPYDQILDFSKKHYGKRILVVDLDSRHEVLSILDDPTVVAPLESKRPIQVEEGFEILTNGYSSNEIQETCYTEVVDPELFHGYSYVFICVPLENLKNLSDFIYTKSPEVIIKTTGNKNGLISIFSQLTNHKVNPGSLCRGLTDVRIIPHNPTPDLQYDLMDIQKESFFDRINWVDQVEV